MCQGGRSARRDLREMNGPMTRVRRASTIAALCVLASAATAYAECAWVLWWQGPRILTPEPIRAFPSRRECMNEIVNLKDAPEYQQWRCLPDTVDPRGPKGR